MSSDTESMRKFVEMIYESPGGDLRLHLRAPEGYMSPRNAEENGDVRAMMGRIDSLKKYGNFEMSEETGLTLYASMSYGPASIAYADQYSINNALSEVSQAMEKSAYALAD